MADKGVIVKRCGCVGPTSRRQLGKNCAMLAQRGHGSRYFHCSTRNLLGRAERIRRGGYPSQAAAQRARDEFLARSMEEQAGDAWSVDRWLRYWLSTRTSIRPTTKLHYTRDVERFLIPYLGPMRLSELTSHRLNAIFAEISKASNRFGRPTSACTLQHIRTTLRAALNAAIREGLIADHPARRVELPTRRRPHPLVWTEQRVTDWEDFGTRPAVAVWTPQQLAEFLDFRDERLYALWWLIALRGLRRGEAAGLRWSDIDLDRGQLEIVRQRTTAGHQVIECAPKSAASARIVALDRHTVTVLCAQAARQRLERERRLAADKEWADTWYVFTQDDGIRSTSTSTVSIKLPPCSAHGPPGRSPREDREGRTSSRTRSRCRRTPIRASPRPALNTPLTASDADLPLRPHAKRRPTQDQLGYASIVMTADTYTSVLPGSQRRAAEATARLVLAAAGRDRKKIKRNARKTRPVTPKKSAAPGVSAKTDKSETAAHRPRRGASDRRNIARQP